jgi:hypothetical protein
MTGLDDDEALKVWKVACLEATSQIMKRVVRRAGRATSTICKIVDEPTMELRIGVRVR